MSVRLAACIVVLILLSAVDPSFAQQTEEKGKKTPTMPLIEWYSCTDVVRIARQHHEDACRKESNSEACHKAIATIVRVCGRCGCRADRPWG